MMINRRAFLTATALSALSLPITALSAPNLPTGNHQGQDNTLGGTLKPYLNIGDYSDDKHRVFMFISFNCPYCKEVWKSFYDWGRTLPQPFKFVIVPLSMGDSVLDMACRCFYAVKLLDENRLNEYTQQAFQLAEKNGNANDHIALLGRMGFSGNQIQMALKHSTTKKRMDRALLLARRYRLSATPHFGIAGKLATNAGYTNGDYQLLVQLLNALVSEQILQGQE
ncbi:MAG: hypothetical protein IJ881_08785 [Neisseriaceae bacterium]|nr:hypothetical protein [Neisseriaceae bacterium]MBR3425855.1 hypothetical protein [Neisseriaceae bacterium]